MKRSSASGTVDAASPEDLLGTSPRQTLQRLVELSFKISTEFLNAAIPINKPDT
jgi:hypothetical protein